MISDFWTGVLATATVVLALIVALAATGIIWLTKRLSRFASVGAAQSRKGGVKLEMEVRE